MNFAEIAADARRAVHSAMAVPCFHTSVLTNTTPAGYGRRYGQSYGGVRGNTPITARLHEKMTVSAGTLDQPGYSTVIEGVLNVLFNREELEALSIRLRRGDKIVFPDFDGPGLDRTYVLDNRFPYDGPVDEKWAVAPP